MKSKKRVVIPDKVWEQIRQEYISTDTSYRQLEKKYGVSYSKIQGMAQRGKWLEEREKFKSTRANKSLDLICDEQAKDIAKAVFIGNKLLDKLEKAVDELDVILVKRTKRTEITEGKGLGLADVTYTEESYEVQDITMVDYEKLKQLTVALKNLKEIGIFRADLDEREQRARIAKLEKEAKEEQTDTEITVVIKGGEDYAD